MSYLHHPEQEVDEIFMGFTTKDFPICIYHWDTARLGKVCSEEKLAGLFPWFVKQAEVKEAILEAQKLNAPYFTDRIPVYQQMLREGRI